MVRWTQLRETTNRGWPSRLSIMRSTPDRDHKLLAARDLKANRRPEDLELPCSWRRTRLPYAITASPSTTRWDSRAPIAILLASVSKTNFPASGEKSGYAKIGGDVDACLRRLKASSHSTVHETFRSFWVAIIVFHRLALPETPIIQAGQISRADCLLVVTADLLITEFYQPISIPIQNDWDQAAYKPAG
ncbi:hypothetical protein T265_01367 [Opisthorchis viverrini]|uniref:Uncharacterized protein n=1 Tax=Opisthorchis viverrini TaxID=6198 RepID=A0A075AAB9_OPIVI|nr:hypothetical protein T265_01367 [Opisthorchis viverrini]KER32690.1 hypothetical protein T265_01367 [Opisthorchis viverrini]